MVAIFKESKRISTENLSRLFDKEMTGKLCFKIFEKGFLFIFKKHADTYIKNCVIRTIISLKIRFFLYFEALILLLLYYSQQLPKIKNYRHIT
ncbi:hypothetical protein BpHYR1_022802 [Brachionus plicatilis]|uniref:Uncharacterized protein n=1 Tax=Brachionus plicatilis TaxID=10195 RepID=A0A3M7SZ10_BRAPC|nr:hypothetical protein BpHYR1_022802 [Brachionus plicatilis]